MSLMEMENGSAALENSLVVPENSKRVSIIAVVQSLSHVRLLVPPPTAAGQASLSFTVSWSWLRFMSIESAMPSNHLTLCCPLLLLPSISPSIRVFSNESTLQIRWPNKLLELQHQSFKWTVTVDFLYDWLIQSPCSPSDSQESSPAPQFQSTNSLALSLLCGPALTSINDYWKKP